MYICWIACRYLVQICVIEFLVMLQVRFSKGDDSMPSGEAHFVSSVTVCYNCNLFQRRSRRNSRRNSLIQLY